MITFKHTCDQCSTTIETAQHDVPSGWFFVSFRAQDMDRGIIAGDPDKKSQVCGECIGKELQKIVATVLKKGPDIAVALIEIKRFPAG